jgi:hypothetical protein
MAAFVGLSLGVAASIVAYKIALVRLDLADQIAGAIAIPFLMAVYMGTRALDGAIRYGIQPVEQLRWTRPGNNPLRITLPRPAANWYLWLLTIMGLNEGMAFILWMARLIPRTAPWQTLLFATTAFTYGLFAYTLSDQMLAPGLLERRALPNEGTRRSFWIAAQSGVLVATPFTAAGAAIFYSLHVPVSHAIIAGSVLGLFYGLGRALQLGWSACMQHWRLRYLLARPDIGAAPLRYTRFLHDAEQRILLRRIGSGFAFHHRLVQEHFDRNGDGLIGRLAIAKDGDYALLQQHEEFPGK